MSYIHLQSSLPSSFKVPPLVQPSWKLNDLRQTLNKPKEHLEQKLSEEYGAKYCILLDSARSGIYLLSAALGLKGEWLSTSFNYRPTAVLMKSLLSNISFADIKDDFTMDPASAEATISSSTEAIYATHMFGKVADLYQLRRLADKKGLFLIENAVHLSNGLVINQRPIGSWGDATLLSFNLDKPLGGLLGGALLTNREDVWQAVKSIQLAPASFSIITERMASSYLGHKLKPLLAPVKRKLKKTTNDLVEETLSFPIDYYQTYSPKTIHMIQASVAVSRLFESNKQRKIRSQHAHYLNSLIDSQNFFQTPQSTEKQPHGYMYYPLIFPEIDRYKLSEYYSKHGIETKWRYYPLHLQNDFKSCSFDSLEKTNSLWCRYLLLPIAHQITKSNLNYIAQITNQFIKQ